MTVQEHAGIGAPARGEALEVYNFRRPTTLAREHLRVLELAFETFARQWGTQLTAKVRVRSQVTCEKVHMHTYDEYAAGLPHDTAMVLCGLEDSPARAVIQFPMSSALSWVCYMVGGNGSVPIPDRKFTHIEQALIRRLMEDALDDLRYSLGTLLLRTISVDAVQYNSQFAQAAASLDLMIIATFVIHVGERTTDATVAIPADVLLPQLGDANPTAAIDNARELIEEQLASVPVDVSLQLKPAYIRPSRILELAVGDILPFPHSQHRPFDVAAGGLPISRAAIGSNGARLACVIVESPAATVKEKP